MKKSIQIINDSLIYIENEPIRELIKLNLDAIDTKVNEIIKRFEKEIHSSCKTCRECNCKDGKISAYDQYYGNFTYNCCSCIKGLKMEVEKLRDQING